MLKFQADRFNVKMMNITNFDCLRDIYNNTVEVNILSKILAESNMTMRKIMNIRIYGCI